MTINNVNIPFSFTNGKPNFVDAEQVNGNFSSLASKVNNDIINQLNGAMGNLDSINTRISSVVDDDGNPIATNAVAVEWYEPVLTNIVRTGTNEFQVNGNQTSVFSVPRRVKITHNDGNSVLYSQVDTSVYASVTTVTLKDSGLVLGITKIEVSTTQPIANNGSINIDMLGYTVGTGANQLAQRNSAGELTGTLRGSVVGNADTATNATTHIAIGVDANDDSAHGATPNNDENKIVQRDANGDFSAGTITAELVGNVTGDLTGTASNAASAVTAVTAQNVTKVVIDALGIAAATAANATNATNAVNATGYGNIVSGPSEGCILMYGVVQANGTITQNHGFSCVKGPTGYYYITVPGMANNTACGIATSNYSNTNCYITQSGFNTFDVLVLDHQTTPVDMPFSFLVVGQKL